VVVAGLHRDRADLAVLDLGGRVLVRREVPVLVEDGPDVVLAVVEQQLEALVAEAGSTWARSSRSRWACPARSTRRADG
jgi:hypothetical protein